MASILLSPEFVLNSLVVPSGKTRVEFCDLHPDARGLYIEVSSSNPGHGTYRLRTKVDGKSTHFVIGKTSEVTLQSARQQTNALKAQLASGVNPKAAETKAAKRMLTFDQYYELHYTVLKCQKRSIKRDSQLYRIRIKPVFGHIPLDQITRQQIQSFHVSLLKSGELAPASCDLHLRFLKHAMFLAQDLGLYPGPNPCSRVPMSGVDNKLQDAPSGEALERLMHVLNQGKNKPVCLAAKYLMATGARVNEGLSARWVDIDIEKRTWVIAAKTAKSGRMRTVPLNDSALDVLRQLDTKDEFEYLFVNRRTKTRFFTIAKAWKRICADANIKARLHSLRHFFGASLACSNVDILTISKLLGHASVTTSQRYSALNQEALLRGSQQASMAMKGVSMQATAAAAPASTPAV